MIKGTGGLQTALDNMTDRIHTLGKRMDSFAKGPGMLRAGEAQAVGMGRPDAGRKYPSYTTDQLKQWVAENTMPADKLAIVKQEIADRESGVSETKVTPQLIGGKVQTKIGRM